MLDKSKRYLIVGLGLLGGKYALELTRAGYTVDGINRSEGHLQFALDHGYIRSGKTTILRTWCKALTTSFSRFTPPP